MCLYEMEGDLKEDKIRSRDMITMKPRAMQRVMIVYVYSQIEWSVSGSL